MLRKLVFICAVLWLVQGAMASDMSGDLPRQQSDSKEAAAGRAALGEKSGTIEFAVTDAEGKSVGLEKIVDNFELKADRYRLTSTFVSKGMRNQFVSEGKIEGDRLVPELFSRNINGQQGFKITIGDRLVTITKTSGSSETLPRPDAPIDIISIMYQAGSVTKEAGTMVFNQVHVYGIERRDIAYIGEETIDTPLGPQHVVHLRSKTSAITQDTWIAPAQRNLPVKFTISANGKVLIATASKIEFR